MGFSMSELEFTPDYELNTQFCGCGCSECELGHHEMCEYGTCWKD